ncbi:hypothetical protein MLD38_004237 [Melastoma candidum]|uniref:Uncharacterized protein n=1 Tax=Melastoma candidum TaxID=119954 RepID=A0ACB9S4T0_9MYRT|nr:hypothetical protein MLD38_004237 [Melastoma candidum]
MAPPPPPPAAGRLLPHWRRNEILVIKYAVISRVLLLALAILWRSFLWSYDTSASINPPCLSSPPSPPPSRILSSLASSIQRSVVWDGVYFVRIAECGYEYEQTYAFFPMLPLLMRFLAGTVLSPLVPMIGYRTLLVLAGYLVSNVAFVLAALYLYRLSVIILRDQSASLRASILFCFNPASIFYSSIYAESLYALFSLGGQFYLFSGAYNLSTVWLALSGLTRSNGMLNAGYICFQTMHLTYNASLTEKRFLLAMRILFAGIVRSAIIFVPFVLFQAFGYYNLCHGRHADELGPWCNRSLPLMYNYIQEHYWGVGFLRYFQFKQLPNFLLASPILTLALCSIISYGRHQSILLLSLGFTATKELISRNTISHSGDVDFSPGSIRRDADISNLRMRKQTTRSLELPVPVQEPGVPIEVGYKSASVLPFIFHLGFMAATAFFVMHVQVATRFLSASAPLYWFASYLMVSSAGNKGWAYLIWVYCAAYILLGSLLFSNFYPFT